MLNSFAYSMTHNPLEATMRQLTLLWARVGIAAMVLTLSAGLSGAQHLGDAAPYNLFTFGDATGFNSDVEGKVAVGGNAHFQNYSIGFKDQGGIALQVGGNLNYNNGSVYGDIYVWGTATIVGVGFPAGGTLYNARPPIDFAAVYNYLRLHSNYWASLTPNGGVTNFFGQLQLSGNDPVRNVFRIDASHLQGIHSVNLLVPTGSTVLINVLGANVVFPNIGYNWNGSQDNRLFQRVLWNLPQATSVSVNSLRGSVLAVDAALTGGYGAIEGQVIVGSFSGPTQVNHWRFEGDLEVVPEPASVVVLGVGVMGLMAVKARRWNPTRR
ncbi:MAG: choice-of-anchor A family protein [Armatimonadetes bacterium]|nr:MAG: choice-of-anchor A family protein [Armatimonadota bacterium]